MPKTSIPAKNEEPRPPGDVKPADSLQRRLPGSLFVSIACIFLAVGYLLLPILSIGTGWTYPNLWPDNIDFAPWARFIRSRDGLLHAMFNSALLACCVATVSTVMGFYSGINLRKSRSSFWTFLTYTPFVLSPVVIGVCLLDFTIRLQLAGTSAGVFFSQLIFAYSFATIFFCETWDDRIEARVNLVRTLGGNRLATVRHAILPKLWPLLVVAWMQTALFSWLDYGLASVIGGGIVPTMTLRVFSYLREASVNQAAQSALVLMTPAVLAAFASAILIRVRFGRGARNE